MEGQSVQKTQKGCILFLLGVILKYILLPFLCGSIALLIEVNFHPVQNGAIYFFQLMEFLNIKLPDNIYALFSEQLSGTTVGAFVGLVVGRIVMWFTTNFYRTLRGDDYDETGQGETF